MNISRKDAIELVEKYIAEFEKSKEFPCPGANPSYAGAKRGTIDLLRELFGEEEAITFLCDITPSAELIKTDRDALFVMHYFYRHVDTCISLLRVYQNKITHFVAATDMPERIIPSTDNVFIIHGHDQANLLRIRNLIKERYKLNPIILSERPSKGRTLIEKFEGEATNAAFAFAVVTPDDLVQAKTGEYVQTRPNVVFEIGWFYGRLGRGRVCILFKEGTRIHSDLDGVVRVQFTTSVEEKIVEIEAELLAVGLLKQ